MDTIKAVTQIQHDFKNQQPPFDGIEFPEKRLLDELLLDGREDKLRAISLFATLDYNRNANQLVDKILEICDTNLLNPSYVAANQDRVAEVFEDISFRYSNRDANGWYTNCQIIADKYNGKWIELLLDTGLDAPRLVKQLNDDGFLYLKGKKIAPMYARIINDEVAPMDDVWELDIPVDTHIRRLSQDLFDSGEDMSDDMIRNEWRGLAIETDISRHIVDGALWQIGNNWESWGKEYWCSL